MPFNKNIINNLNVTNKVNADTFRLIRNSLKNESNINNDKMILKNNNKLEIKNVNNMAHTNNFINPNNMKRG